MAQPTLEWVGTQNWGAQPCPTTNTWSLTGPTGTKALVTVCFAYYLTTVGWPPFSNVRFEFDDVGITPKPCTLLGRTIDPSGHLVVEFWYATNVPIGFAATGTRTYVRGDLAMTCASESLAANRTCPSGLAEFGYWIDAVSATWVTGTSGQSTLAGWNGAGQPAIAAEYTRDSFYGYLIGKHVTSASAWHLAGYPGMERANPHQATPAEFSNDTSVAFGGLSGWTTTLRTNCGFYRFPISPEWPFAFDLGTLQDWSLSVIRLKGPVSVAIPSRLATIVG
jgi:hypothetical protein